MSPSYEQEPPGPRRHERRVWLLWAVGAALLLATPLALADPALAMLLLDPELLAITVMAALGLVRTRVVTPFQRRRRPD